MLIFTPDTQLRPRYGLEPSRMRLRADEAVVLDGLRVTTLARALYDEMLRAGSVREALAVLDAGTSRASRGARTGRDSVRDLVARHKKTRGIVRVRAAVELGSERVASRGGPGCATPGWRLAPGRSWSSYDATRLVALERRTRVGRRRGLSRQRRYDRWSTVPPAWWYGSQLAQTWGYPPWR
ncbi:MAG: hypothetical protein M3Q87_06995 [Actinomycetota bacterium]|nr:hypothetical protein [Actinomycetota bacterium]